MLDVFMPGDPPNPLATTIFRKLYCNGGEVDDAIPGVVFLSNETDEDVVDFAREDFAYLFTKAVFF